MASRLTVARGVRQLTSHVSRRPAPFACRRWQPMNTERRLFSVNGALREKKYTEDHEWIDLSSDGKTVTLGISSYAAKSLGDVVYIELPQTDLEVNAGDAIGAVESVKSASDILTPITGTVVDVNSVLEEKPGNVNKDPEGDAWIAKLEVKEGAVDGVEGLMTSEEYGKFTEDI